MKTSFISWRDADVSFGKRIEGILLVIFLMFVDFLAPLPIYNLTFNHDSRPIPETQFIAQNILLFSSNESDAIERMNDYVHKNIAYDNKTFNPTEQYSPFANPLEETLKRGTGVCWHKSLVLCSFAKSAGFRCVPVVSHVENSEFNLHFFNHVYVFIEGKNTSLYCDPTRGVCWS